MNPVVQLPAGDALPALGLGTWRMGESRAQRAAEVAAVVDALRAGYRLIDTAEMYGEGGAERVVGEALRESLAGGALRREELVVVSKVYPHNAGRHAAVEACERSLERLGLECLDLYLLHWRGSFPLAETVGAFEALREAGRIRRWGVSNFDVGDMNELRRVPGGEGCAVNQVWYSAGQRGAEYELLPALEREGIAAMAYSPIDQSALARHARLAEIGRRLGFSAAQVALAWVLRRPNMTAIPKAVQPAHLRENLAAASLRLDDEVLAAIDAAFPPPRRRGPLAMN